MFSSFLAMIGLLLYLLGLLAGLVLVPLGFPGTWLIALMAVSYGALTHFQSQFGDAWVIGIVVGLAVIAEILEYGIGVVGSKKLNVSNGAIVFSMIGGFIGAIIGVPILLIGSLIGLLVGVLLGAFIYELFRSRNLWIALQAAVATFFSRITALFIKTIIALAMVSYLLMKTF